MLSITPRKTLVQSYDPILSVRWFRIHLPSYSVQIFLVQFLIVQYQNNTMELSQDNQTGGRALVSPFLANVHFFSWGVLSYSNLAY